MSNNFETNSGQSKLSYDRFTPEFYKAWGHYPEVIQQARDINAFIIGKLEEHGVTEVAQLPPEAQREINARADVVWMEGGLNE